MSSEVYVSWEVRRDNLQKAIEKELREIRELNRMIAAGESCAVGTQSIAAAAKTEKLNNISNYKTEMKVVTGISENVENVQLKSAGNAAVRGEAIDLSGYIDSFETANSAKAKKSAYAKDIGEQLSAAVLVTNDDVKAYNSFVSYLNGLLKDDELDFDFFKTLVDRRLEDLKNKELFIDDADREALEEYIELCRLCGEEPKKLKAQQLKAEKQRMFDKYAKKKSADIVYQNLIEVFAELDMSIDNDMQLDGLSGYRIVDKTLPDCSVFMSMDGRGIVFETIADVDDSETLSSDKKAKIEADANKVCQKHLQVIQKMQQRGISLKIECEEKPHAEYIRKQAKKTARRAARGKAQEKYIEG